MGGSSPRAVPSLDGAGVSLREALPREWLGAYYFQGQSEPQLWCSTDSAWFCALLPVPDAWWPEAKTAKNGLYGSTGPTKPSLSGLRVAHSSASPSVNSTTPWG